MDKLLIQRKALKVRELFGIDSDCPIDLFALLSTDSDITLVVYPFHEDISGMCIKPAKLIAINSTSTKGRQMFSLAHELYHFFYDDKNTSLSYFSSNKANDKLEQEANLFASYLLMPDSSFSNMCDKLTNNRKDKIDVIKIMELEQYYRTSRKAVFTRLMMEGLLSQEDEYQFNTEIIKTAKSYGYDTSLYHSGNSKEPKTYGAYLKKALDLKNSRLISEGKYEEYLLDAYRSDIVFDENGTEEKYD